MGSEDVILLVHAASTWFMVGLIWTIQMVHYPLFARVGAADYESYHRSHMTRITWIVAPAMFVELFATGAVAWVIGSPLAWLGVALLAFTWFSTFALQVPLHNKLARGFDRRIHGMLVSTNWLRTLLWTARGLVSLILILQAMESAS